MLTSKAVLVTGAAKGIGLGVCRQLAGLGYKVILTARNAEAGAAAAASITRQIPESIRFLQMDVADVASIQKVLKTLQGEGVHLFGLVNNAGILPPYSHHLDSATPEQANEIFQTNALGPSYAIQTFLPLFERGSRIVNVSSGLGRFGQGFSTYAPLYSATKTTLNVLTRQWANTLRDRGIAVNAVDPGWVKTDMGGVGANRSVSQGAAGIVWLLHEAPAGATGRFWHDGHEVSW